MKAGIRESRRLGHRQRASTPSHIKPAPPNGTAALTDAFDPHRPSPHEVERIILFLISWRSQPASPLARLEMRLMIGEARTRPALPSTAYSTLTHLI